VKKTTGNRIGFVIVKNVRYFDSVADPLIYIAGYTIVNDVSQCAFQLERGGNGQKENLVIILLLPDLGSLLEKKLSMLAICHYNYG